MTEIPPVYMLTGEYPPMVGGIADYTYRLAEQLQSLGLDMTVLVGSDFPVAADRCDGAVPIERLRGSVRRWGLLEAAAQRLGVEPCILHIQYQTAAFGMAPPVNLLPWWLRGRRPATRTVVTFHDVRLPYLFPKAGPLREWVTRWMIDHAHAAIFADEGDRRWAGGAPNHALIPIGSGVPVVPWQTNGGDARGGFRLGYFGFMNATKGLSTLLEAVAELVTRGRELRLILIGDSLGVSDPTNAQTRASVEQAIERHGLADHIERTGPLSLEDVSLELQRCDALAFPFEDGASFRRSSLTAALAHARPVITTLRPTGENGIRGFASGESVLLVPPGDTPALASAIGALMDDESLRRRLAAGAAAASALLEWPRIAAGVREVYASVIDSSTVTRITA